ncbi:MAG TPA: signal peptidase I, partial [Pyrinomonadaceae bacterium]
MNDDYTGVAEAPSETKTGRPVGRARDDGHDGAGRAGTAVERKRQGPPKTVWREYFESAVVTVIMALFGMTFVVQAVKVPTGSMQNTITIGDHLLVNKFIFAAGPALPFLPQREIRRGDIVVFKYPGNNYERWRDQEHENNTPFKTNYVKRVIGLPGDRVEVRGTEVLINGKPLPERVVIANDACPGPPGDAPCHNAPLKIADDSAPTAGKSYTVFYSNLLPHSPDEKFPIFRFEGNGTELTVPADSYFVMGDNR